MNDKSKRKQRRYSIEEIARWHGGGMCSHFSLSLLLDQNTGIAAITKAVAAEARKSK